MAGTLAPVCASLGGGGMGALVHAADVAEMELLGDPRIGYRRFRANPHCADRPFSARVTLPFVNRGDAVLRRGAVVLHPGHDRAIMR